MILCGVLFMAIDTDGCVGVALGGQGAMNAGGILSDLFQVTDAAIDLGADRDTGPVEGQFYLGVALGAGDSGMGRKIGSPLINI